ncbi:competence protein ComEA [[Clostridium] sordellii]|uniref:helix-hairpin-helix domain-containing protein n=1 Tax=Paraclostridium sordellii TaxID=1505 RepID=UPI0005DB835E|nr:helix-hairpin-helix domain-containing protein [Paeniclostridium sordellii]MDU4412212.1 helix-hairpin-helix domain-containing protein [Paeniclostridium sordellii]MRZ27639.1 competence protein ComE [Paeniclostridium sordellii]CEO36325.1 competence protein ComEA [[Clostridium] sordellii] [Paeniclostridium sordellii]CEP92191.1 competence protein ComEA [[Clostridium] sordellii] [Paeniclostridium sordellii]CEQ07055.1 competence protein ComEA [[Clostridium] sordellii] [Paeniclostridium sordellii]
MSKIRKFFPVLVIVCIIFVFFIKNITPILKNDNYIVSQAEDKKEINKNFEPVQKVEDLNMDNSEKINTVNKKITIFISGEVKSPGVVELYSEDRLMDGVKKCGGVTDEADMNRINLAMKISDEGHYIIPKIGEEIENVKDKGKETVNQTQNLNDNKSEQNKENNKININNASLIELDSLPGVGEVTAQKIIDYREENTKFKSIEEIKNVKGIGENKFNNLKDYISI